MAKQTINPGVAPTGAGGDTFRSGSAKLQANDNEIYNYLGDGTNLNKLGTAAFKNTGTQAGNVLEVGVFGFGSVTSHPYNTAWGVSPSAAPNAFVNYNGSNGIILKGQASNSFSQFWITTNSNTPKASFYTTIANGSSSAEIIFRTTANTTVDGNGFVKAASPIVKLFADKIELNDEAQRQNVEFEKLGVGDYLIKGSSGFAQEGWYVETPKDANGNLLVAVVYEQLENGGISVKTYDYMLNKKGRIVADTETPLDIPENRWIDIRLQELPQPEIEVTDDSEQ